jgi:dihydrofolate reductase
MTRLILQMGISIDGCVAARDGSQPWLGGREDDAAKQWKLDTVRGADAHLWAETHIASGDLNDEIASIKARPGGYVIAYGGAGLARSLVRGGLVDEYRLNIHPAALGTGMAIFSELPEPLELELVEAREFAGGNVGRVYVPHTS